MSNQHVFRPSLKNLLSASHEQGTQMHGAPRPGNLFGSFAYKPPGSAPGKAPLNLVGSRSLAQSQPASVQLPSGLSKPTAELCQLTATATTENTARQEENDVHVVQTMQGSGVNSSGKEDGVEGTTNQELSDEWHVKDKRSHAEGADYPVVEIVKPHAGLPAPAAIPVQQNDVKNDEPVVCELSPVSPAVQMVDPLEDDDADDDMTGFQRKGAKRKLANILSSPDENSPPVPTKRAPIAQQDTSVIDLTSDGDEAKPTTRPSDNGVATGRMLHSNSTTALSDTVNLDGSTRSGSLPPRPGRLEGLGRLGGLGGLKMQAQRPVGLTSGPPLRMKLQAPQERAAAAQQHLRQHQASTSGAPGKARRRAVIDDDDSDGEQQAQDDGTANLLARVEEISNKLRLLLESQRLENKFLSEQLQSTSEGDQAAIQGGVQGEAAATSTIPAEQQQQGTTGNGGGSSGSSVLVGRPDIAAACDPSVAASLKGYQLVGINFLMLLSKSGSAKGAILADEMGLGKTAQTITFLGVHQHRERMAWQKRRDMGLLGNGPSSRGPRPHLIICPASLLENWQRELAKWCPQLKVVTLYGEDKSYKRDALSAWYKTSGQGKAGSSAVGGGSNKFAEAGRKGRGGGSDEDDDDSESEADHEFSDDEELGEVFGFKFPEPSQGDSAPFDVMLTTYSIYERESQDARVDRKFLSKWRWSHLVADEAHALKNRNSVRVQKLMKVAKCCQHRILLTGTPLQNDVTELLNLLRFLMPSLFDDEDEDAAPDVLLGLQTKDPEAMAQLTDRVRRIMAPFILRRLKSEVANQLVEKQQVVISVDMLPEQADCYKALITKLKAEAAALVSGKAGRGATPSASVAEASDNRPSKRRKADSAATVADDSEASDASFDANKQQSAAGNANNGDDSDYCEEVTPRRRTRAAAAATGSRPASRQGSKGGRASAESSPQSMKSKKGKEGPGVADDDAPTVSDAQLTAVAANADAAVSKLGAQKINNLFTHLRKVALHPLLVRRQYTEQQMMEIAKICVSRRLFGGQCTLDRVTAEMASWSDHSVHQFACTHEHVLSKYKLSPEAIYGSAKMLELKRLLVDLKAKGSKVLLFSQWTQVLDLLEWFMDMEGYAYCRLDGSTQVDERLAIVDQFNDPEGPLFVFLLSTRAGGQGLNLTGADTVILHDVDFNPQVDRQAEDRCHRLGQTKPVTVYRLVTKDSVDQNIYDIAQRKLQLDAAIIGNVTVGDEDTATESSASESAGGGGGSKRGRAAGSKGAQGKAGAGAESKHMGAILAALLRDK